MSLRSMQSNEVAPSKKTQRKHFSCSREEQLPVNPVCMQAAWDIISSDSGLRRIVLILHGGQVVCVCCVLHCEDVSLPFRNTTHS